MNSAKAERIHFSGSVEVTSDWDFFDSLKVDFHFQG